MATKRGKTQARRSGGSSASGLPGWAWLVLGVALTLVVVLLAPRMFKHEGDGFFRPTPNPDAQPKPVTDDAVVDDETAAGADADRAPKPSTPADKESKPRNFDFYTLLPGKETPLSDAELAAREKAEKQVPRDPAPKPVDSAAANPVTNTTSVSTATPAGGRNSVVREPEVSPAPLPVPVDDTAHAAASTHAPHATAAATPASSASAASTSSSNTSYLLQAGAFAGAQQADELKAKIALLGLGARVESARIGERTVYRVRMGPYGTASDLAEAKRKLASGGLAGMAVKVN